MVMESTERSLPAIRSAECQAVPFSHFALPGVLDAETASAVVDWLDDVDGWQERHSAGFCRYFELIVSATPFPPRLAFLNDRPWLDRVRDAMAATFGIDFGSHVSLAIHKFVPGCGIRLHTDHGTDPDTHRFIIHLNRGWSEDNGGLLLLLDGARLDTLDDSHRYYLPDHRLAVGFEISDRSFHAVSEVISGTRYTLCYSLRSTAGAAWLREH